MANNGKMVVSKEAWNRLESNDREWLMFDTMQSLDKRLSDLEDKGFFHKACSAVGGVIGGALAAFGIKWWG